MSANKGPDDAARSAAAESVRRAFGALPFGEKVSTLVRVELDMLGDAAASLAGAVEKVADDLASAFTECEPSPSADPGKSGQQAAG